MSVKSVLLLGSGGLKIGEAGEFDYSGSQAIKALKEEGVRTVLLNPNIATVQTSAGLADRVYFLPVTAEFAEEVIRKERPEGILLSFGGQTALNCGLALAERGILDRFGVRVLGTSIAAIRQTEDRAIFAAALTRQGLPVPRSLPATTVAEALAAARTIGYPVMVRSAYSLGGLGSGRVGSEAQFRRLLGPALAGSSQLLVEEYLCGWKELEYEVLRDGYDNAVTVCNMENLDPLGIHTGESIVVAPSQTLSNAEYHELRAVALQVIRSLGIVGECNIQFALDPAGKQGYRIIEVNARLSRSSALASKATGYPLAFVSAKLALGHSLPELRNCVTGTTTACFEPALDYVVVKIPRWDLDKFRRVSKRIGSGMKSVGEVMAIGRKFEEALQKAVRMLETGADGLQSPVPIDDLEEELTHPTDRRLFAVAEALRRGMAVAEIHGLTRIDPWFLHRIRILVEEEKALRLALPAGLGENLPAFRRAKELGFSDRVLARFAGTDEETVRCFRWEQGFHPVAKEIDTLAGEFPATTRYFYLTYNGTEHERRTVTPEQPAPGKTVVVLGSGAYRIGSSVEFDYCCVKTVQALKRRGLTTVMINHNPETVSTDYDECDVLYFDELSLETVLEVARFEQPSGVVVSMGGQVPNRLALPLHRAGIPILGTSPKRIDEAEDREKFSTLLDRLGVDQPEWRQCPDGKAALEFARQIGYPLLVRPSYVLSGAAMSVVLNDHDLEEVLARAVSISPEHPVVVSRFIRGAKEIEYDGIASGGRPLAWAITEHVENAGVHSGDATLVLPPQKVYCETLRRLEMIAGKICAALEITGPFNLQFLAKSNDIKVIECNLRASRSLPFVSKVSHCELLDLAVTAMLGQPLPADLPGALHHLPYVGVKAPQFSYSRLTGADPVLSVEMNSTGEVACLGEELGEALLKAILSAGLRWPKGNVLLSIHGDHDRYIFLEYMMKLLEMGFRLYATHHTHEFLKKLEIPSILVYKVHDEEKEPNILTLLSRGEIGLAIVMTQEHTNTTLEDDYSVRRTAVDFGVPLISNISLARSVVDALARFRFSDLRVKAWDEYR